MTPDEVRAIVREEIAAIAGEAAAVNNAESVAYKALVAHQVEVLMDELQLPDDARETLKRHTTALLD